LNFKKDTSSYHNDLKGLNTGDYKHLNTIEYLNATNYASPYTDGILSATDYNKLNSNGGKVTYKGHYLKMLNPIQFVNQSYNTYNTSSITSYKNYSFDKLKYFELFSISNNYVITLIYDETFGKV
jgi:hypothetical protein